MAKVTDPRPCPWCGTPIPPSDGPGRPRKWCRRECRQRAYEERVIRNGISIAMLGERDGWICFVCGDPVDPDLKSGWAAPCVDHIIPTSKGGQTAFENLSVIHVRCNSVKGDRIIGHPTWGEAA